MYNEDLNTQYVIMTDENEYGYIPNYDELIQEAPNDEMKAKWIESKERHEKYLDSDFPKASSFAFNGIYMKKMSCGHYEIFQHHVRNEDDLVEWIALMNEEEKGKKCTRCICGA